MYMDVMKNISLQSLGSTIGSVLMIVILTSAPILTKKWDLVAIIRTCLFAGFVGMVGLLAYVLMVPNFNNMLFVVWMALANACITMSVQMQWGLVAESIDYNEYLTGKRNEGTIYGFFSLSRRLGSTIASSLSVLVIAAIGYDPALTNAGLDQAASTIAGIKLMVVGFPCLAALGSFCCFTFIWCINKDVRAKMAEWKAAKAAK
jgi:Na+/melibiose symporter-like transporter